MKMLSGKSRHSFYATIPEQSTVAQLRAHPGSKFFVANTLAKWKKL